MLPEAVVVTGAGLFCPLGSAPAAAWDRLQGLHEPVFALSTRRGAERVAVARVEDFELRRFVDRNQARFMTRHAALGLAAARTALQQSGILEREPGDLPCYVAAPSLSGDASEDELVPLQLALDERGNFDSTRYAKHVGTRVSPLHFLKHLSNTVSWAISLGHELRGDNLNFCSGGTSASSALRAAFLAIRSGRRHSALVVAYDGIHSGLGLIKSGLAQRASAEDSPATGLEGTSVRPAEAGVALVLEAATHAREAGLETLAHVVGCGSAFDAFSEASAMRRSVEQALGGAHLSERDVDYIHTDGGGGYPHWRALEKCIRAGSYPDHLLVSSTTYATGLAPAASGLLGALFAGWALRTGTVPPVAGDPNVAGTFSMRIPTKSIHTCPELALVLTADPYGAHDAVALRRASHEGYPSHG